MDRQITEEMIESYISHLYEQEKSPATIEKYIRDLRKLIRYAAGSPLTKTLMIDYKHALRAQNHYKTTSINSFIIAANRFFEYMEWYDLRIKTYKLQQEPFTPENREITKPEYKKLLETAHRSGKTRIGMIIQTICATGIRVSELSAITVSAVKTGIATINNKGKERRILIPRDLQVRLLHYIRKKHIKSGPVFCTSGNKPVDRTYIWREMKKLCESAGIDKEKVFPHNLRHLFARTFYNLYKDIAKLADVLGHGSIETTRIYLRESLSEHRKHLDRMDLVS